MKGLSHHTAQGTAASVTPARGATLSITHQKIIIYKSAGVKITSGRKGATILKSMVMQE